jgi:hypothetical protein
MLVTKWTPKVRKHAKNEDFKTFVDNCMYISYILFHQDHPLRLFPECKKLLQLSQDTKVGDWYIFENHTIIRIYGYEIEPYLL